MEPLRIRFTLASPLPVPEHPIHLDALLAFAAVAEAEAAGHPDPYAVQDALPLASEDGAGGVVWCASQLMFRPLAPPHALTMTKRFELDDLALRRGRVFSGGPDKLTQGTGPYKSFVVTHAMIWSAHAVAYAIGDRARIAELLERIPSIGKLRRVCSGRISACEITSDARAQTAWRYRRLPRAHADFVPVEATVRPPYWDRTRRTIAFTPTMIPEALYDES